MNKVNIKVNSHDIFNFVVGNSVFDPIERCIDPTRYEVFDGFVYDSKTKEKMNKCLKDSNSQDEILNQRINAQRKYKIESTPTIIVNEKKYDNKVDYKTFKKVIDKNL